MKCFFDICDQAVEHAVKTKSFGVFYSDTKKPNQNVHVHECCEIFLCLKGGNTFLIDGKVFDISDGDLFVINQFEAHKVVSGRGNVFSRYIMHVDPSFLYANSMGEIHLSDCFYVPDRATRISLAPDEVARLVGLFEALRDEHAFGDELYKKLRATELLLEIGGLFATHRDPAIGESRHRTVQLAVEYINSHYATDLTLAEVAKNAYISQTQLSRLFNRYCGTTVTKYITGKRITEAKKLLAAGKSVTDTAYLCGFNDYANFIRVFKRAVGVPPGKYKSFEL